MDAYYILAYRILFVLILFSRVSALSYHECVELFDTPAQGRYVCSTHSDLVPALQLAEREGRKECERAFKDAAWNCSGFSLLKAPNVTSRSKKENFLLYFVLFSCMLYNICGVYDSTMYSMDNIPYGRYSIYVHSNSLHYVYIIVRGR